MTTDRSPLRVHIRWMIRRDMPEVLAIESASTDHPWTEDQFLALLRQCDVIGMVAEHGEDVVGMMLYQLRKTSIRILNFAVASTHRRRTIGRQMVAKLMGKLSAHRRTRIVLAIRETNLAGANFFKAEGFRATNLLREYFEDTGEDAYVLNRRLECVPAAAGRDIYGRDSLEFDR